MINNYQMDKRQNNKIANDRISLGSRDVRAGSWGGGGGVKERKENRAGWIPAHGLEERGNCKNYKAT